MHLLHYVNGKLSLTRFIGSNIPPYAILSHTWGTDAEEVTFEELLEGIGENKAGYEKIRLCGAQAIKDGLEYFWVDTCCIDKRSSAELSEAINSMYRWYQLARFCYVHLADVTLVGDVLDSDTKPETLQERAPNFYNSRWFTRGWTLQELLAPHASSLRFYTADWKLLGTKDELASQIPHITKIRMEYLIMEELDDARKIHDASVAERMSWASRRVTTREEDIAYCLLGVFNVNMPLLYGEASKAFLRLQDEILKTSEDQSIFAWGVDWKSGPDPGDKFVEFANSTFSLVFSPHDLNTAKQEICSNPLFALGSEKQITDLGYNDICFQLYTILAPSPLFFMDAGDYIHAFPEETGEPCTITSRGMRLDTTIVANARDVEFMMLNCEKRGSRNYRAVILIFKSGLANGRIGFSKPFLFDAFRHSDIQRPRKSQLRYFHTSELQLQSADPFLPGLYVKRNGLLIIRRTPPLETGWRIVAFQPQARWDAEQRVLHNFDARGNENIYIRLHNMRSNKYLDIEFTYKDFHAQYEMKEPPGTGSTNYIDADPQYIIVTGGTKQFLDRRTLGYVVDIGCRSSP